MLWDLDVIIKYFSILAGGSSEIFFFFFFLAALAKENSISSYRRDCFPSLGG